MGALPYRDLSSGQKTQPIIRALMLARYIASRTNARGIPHGGLAETSETGAPLARVTA